MSKAKRLGGLDEELRERMRRLGLKARIDPHSLTLEDLDEMCSLTVALGPTGTPLYQSPIPLVFREPFEPLIPDASDLDTQALLRLAHAAENIAFQLSEIVRLAKEDVVQKRWEAVQTRLNDTDRSIPPKGARATLKRVRGAKNVRSDGRRRPA